MALVQRVSNVGVHENWGALDFGRRPNETLERYPGAAVARNVFINRTTAGKAEDLRPRVDAALRPFLTAGTPKVYISIKTPIAATRNGDWNAKYAQLGAHLAAINTSPHPTVVDFLAWHEPENDFSSGAAYAHYANKVRQHMKAGGGEAVNVGYSAMAYQWSPNRPATANPAQWRQAEMDFYCVDVYSGRSYRLDIILPEHSGFLRWFREIADFGSRSGAYRVTERGFETPSQTYPEVRYELRNETITREFDWLRDNAVGKKCYDYVYWSSSGTEDATGLLLDPTGETIVAARIAEFFQLNRL